MAEQMLVLLNMEIVSEKNNKYMLQIKERDKKAITSVTFNTESHELHIDLSTEIGLFLKENEYQFRKLLHNKRPKSFYPGFILDFSIIRQKDIEAFNDKTNIVVSEGRNIHVIQESNEILTELYTDGSYCELNQTGAWGYAYIKQNEIVEECYKKASSQSSSHLELLAVIEGLNQCKNQRIRVFTDSQYVRKGITEWIFHWRENGFKTANGTQAKNFQDWILLDNIISHRYIEWCWIKGHRTNEWHNHVDKYVGKKAREVGK